MLGVVQELRPLRTPQRVPYAAGNVRLSKGNANQQSTRRAQDRESVSQALERDRQAGTLETGAKGLVKQGDELGIDVPRQCTQVR
jgi:hypothetical protein